MTSSPRFLEILSSDQIELIHLTALRILEDIGLWLPHQEILEILHEGGARVDFNKQMAFIQAHIVESSIKKFPSRFTWHARSIKNTLDMNGVNTYFSGPDSAINVIGLDGSLRLGTPEDGVKVTRLVDGLSNLAVATEGIHPREITGTALDAWHAMTVYTNSNKAIIGSSRSKASSEVIIRMAKVVAQSCGLPEG